MPAARDATTGRFISSGSGQAFSLSGSVGIDITPALQGLSALDTRVSEFGVSFAQGFGIGAGVSAFTAGLQAISGSLGALKGSVIDFNQQMDMSKAIFTRYFEGNTQLADAFLNSLKRFAAETPFEFKDLSSLSVRLQSVGVAANDIIPTIKAIGNAASSSGSLSQEALGRIGLAIQQMIGKGKVSAEEMNQLIEGGVTNAWQILAKEVGVTEAQVRKMSEAGEISGETMVKALRNAYENAGLMEQASKSLTGALSTIRDVGTQAFADMGRGIYDLATEGANQLAKLLSSEQFQTWVQAGTVAVNGLVATIKSGFESLAPVGEAISKAFGQLASGDFSGAFGTLATGAQAALSSVMDTITSFASQMVGAGENIVGEFATGILNGANGVLQTAIDTVANIIASFLIGESPPPAGPLAQIQQGGANVMAAWGKGAADAADSAVKPAADKVAGGLFVLKDAARGVNDAIREIGSAIGDLDGQLRDVKFSIDDIKDGYKDQLDPLQAQLDAITQRKDYEYEEQSLMLDLEASALQRAENEAQGSREVRARIDDQIEELNLQKKGIEQAAKREELDKKARGERSAAEDRLEKLRDAQKDRRSDDSDNSRVSGLQKQLDALRERPERRGPSDAEKALEALRDTGNVDDSPLLKSIQGHIAQLKELSNQPAVLTEAAKRLRELQDQAKTALDNPVISQLQGQIDGLQSQTANQAPSVAERELDRLKSLSTGGSTSRDPLADEKEALRVQEARLSLADRESKINERATKGENVASDRQKLSIDQQQLDISIRAYAIQKQADAAEIQRQKDISAATATVEKEKAAAAQAELDRQNKIKDIQKQIAAEKKKDQDSEQARQREIAQLEIQTRKEKEALDAQEQARKIEIANLEKQAATEKDRLDQAEESRKQRMSDLEKQIRKEKEDADKQEDQRKKKADDLEKQIAAEKKKDQDDQKARQREIDDADRAVRDEKRTAQMAEAERQSKLAGIDRQILDLNQQKADLVDKPRLAAIKDAQAELKERKDILDSAQKEEKLRRDMAALPIKQQIEEIKQQEKERLAPLQEQLDSLTRQKAALTEQKQAQQEIKAEIQAQATAIRDAEAATKAAAKAAKEARDAAPKAPTDKSFTPDAIAEQAIKSAKENGARLASQMRDGFVEWITANPIVTGASIAGILFGAGQGAALGASLGSVVPVIGTAIGGVLGAGIGAAIGGVAAGQLAGQLQGKIEQIIGQPVMAALSQKFAALKKAFNEDGFGGIVSSVLDTIGDATPRIGALLTQWGNAFLDWVRTTAPLFFNGLQRIIDGVYTWIDTNAGPIGAKFVSWATAFVQWVGGAGLDLLGKLAAFLGDVLGWIGANATKLAGKLLDWATEFVAWVGPVIPKLLAEFGGLVVKVVEWMGQHTGQFLDALGKWAVEFVEWVGPKIGPLLIELGKLLASLVDWTVHTALPAIGEKLAEWGAAFIDWVGPRIVPFVTEVGKILAAMIVWFATDALPKIVEQLGKWGAEFIAWVAPVVMNLPDELVKIGAAVTTWIASKINPEDPSAFPQKLMGWVNAFLAWPFKVGEQIGVVLGRDIAVNIQKWLNDYVNPNNPESVVSKAAAMGAGMLDGIKKGLTDNWADLQNWITEHIGKQLPEWMQKLLGIHSPSTVFHDIGENLIAGLIRGMESKSGDLMTAANNLFGSIGGPGAIGIPTGALVDLARMMAGEYGIDPGVFTRQIQQESKFDPNALNPTSGAAGLGQLMPDTAKDIARALGMSVAELMGNPANQLRGAAYYDRQMLDMFHGDVIRMLAAYNWGPGNVMGWNGNQANLPGETQTYLHNILGLASGAIINPTPGGTLVRVGEGTRREVVAPLPDWMNPTRAVAAAPMQTHRFVVQEPSGRVLAEWYVKARDAAVESRRVPLGTM